MGVLIEQSLFFGLVGTHVGHLGTCILFVPSHNWLNILFFLHFGIYIGGSPPLNHLTGTSAKDSALWVRETSMFCSSMLRRPWSSNHLKIYNIGKAIMLMNGIFQLIIKYPPPYNRFWEETAFIGVDPSSPSLPRSFILQATPRSGSFPFLCRVSSIRNSYH